MNAGSAYASSGVFYSLMVTNSATGCGSAVASEAITVNTLPKVATAIMGTAKGIRNALAPEIGLGAEEVTLLTSEDDYQQYLDKGIPMLQNIDKHWPAADSSGKQRIVGSIFPQKLVFEKTTYRTIGENPVLALIAATGAGFSMSKIKKASNSAGLSN